jgi:hypothetical protein
MSRPTLFAVIAAVVAAVVSIPLSRLLFFGTESSSGSLSDVAAWEIFGFGIGQSYIIGTGVLIAVTVAVTYRLATRGNRYDHHHKEN